MNHKPDDPNQSATCSALPFDEVVELFVAELRNGASPSIAKYRERYPHCIDEINELFPMLCELESHQKDSEIAQDRPGIDNVPDQLGDYEIIREIGRGGMGVVYEARHSTMQRRVALKVLPRTFGEQSQFVDRFVLEARSAGKLHHTNIVPVFEIGKQDGVHFYAMQLIHGQNLDVVIDELRRIAYVDDSSSATSSRASNPANASVAMTIWQGQTTAPGAGASANLPLSSTTNADGTSEWSQIGDERDSYYKRVAKVGIQIADALDFAHEHDLLHRDIKPSNLILDINGIVWITDFGLAKVDGDKLTHTGDIVGTIRYMAPERFKGQADGRSDLYSLGLTLYELCTLEYAFDATDRAALINQVMNDSPASLRKIRGDVPIDLETVIVKAMAREPDSRYRCARDMAEDLRRFVAGQPVLARRVSSLERLVRWGKRHPSRAALAICLMLLGSTIVAASLFFGYQQRMHSSELALENQRARDAEAEARKAEKEALIAEKDARELAKKAQRATKASNGHRFWAHYNAGKALRNTGAPGQRGQALNELFSAYQSLKNLGLSKPAERRRQLAVRSEAIAALGSWEMSVEKSWQPTQGLTGNCALDEHNGRYARIAEGGDIEIRGQDSEKLIVRLAGINVDCWAVLFSPNGEYLASLHHPAEKFNDRELVVWNVSTGESVFRIPSGKRPHRFQFSNDSRRIVVSRDSAATIFATKDGTQLSELTAEGRVTQVHFAHDDENLILVSQPSNVIQFWSIERQQIVRSIEIEDEIFSMDWNDKLKQLAVGGTRTIRVWPPGELDSEPTEMIAHTNRVTRVFLDPKGRLLASSGWDNATRVFELTHFRQILQAFSYQVGSSGFTADGRQLLFTSRTGEAGIWRVDDFRARSSMKVPPVGKPQKLRFYPLDSQILATISESGVALRNHISGTDVGAIDFDGIYDFRFTDDGKYIVTSGLQGVHQWPIQYGEGSLEFGEPNEISSEPCKFLDVSDDLDKIVIRFDKPHAKIVSPVSQDVTKVGPHHRLNHAWLNPSGDKVVTTTWQGKGIKVWDANDGSLIKDLDPDCGTAFFEFSPDGRWLATSTSQNQAIWNVETLEKEFEITREKADGVAGKVAWSSDQKMLVCNYRSFQPQLIDPLTGETLAVLDSNDHLRTNEMRFSHDDRYLAIFKADRLHVWDLSETRKRLKDLGMDW